VARRDAFLVAAALLVALAVGGPRPTSLALAIAVLALLFAPTGRERSLSRRVEAAVVVFASLGVMGTALWVANPDRPLGTDWMAYLKNAVALATGDLDSYQRWRGPLHAWACLAGTAVTGNLVSGSILVSVVSATACVPLMWWLTRRLFGPGVALVAVGLFAGWADLTVFAASSTPYPLYAALTLAGLTLGVESRGRTWVAALSGIAFALAIATDLRGEAVLAGAVLSAAIDAGSWRVRLARVVLLAAFGAGTGAAVLAAAPVELVPLGEQVALQRDLNAREGSSACPPRGMATPTFEEMAQPCSRVTAASNLGRGDSAVPFGLAGLLAFAALGALLAGRSAPWLVLPFLPLVPSLFLFGLQHRYFVPIAPLFAALGGLVLHRISRPGPFRAGLLVATCAALAAGWSLWPGGLASRAREGRAIDPALALPSGQSYSSIGAALRRDLQAGDRVIDCTRAGFNLRVYPHPVEVSTPRGPGQLGRKCREVLDAAPADTWVIAALPDGQAVEKWQAFARHDEGPGVSTVLLHH
jgi:hypothetical protein